MMLSPVIAELAEELNGKVKVGKVNVDEQNELAMQYRVASIPTLLLFKNGENH
jgi:thioredoxin 1